MIKSAWLAVALLVLTPGCGRRGPVMVPVRGKVLFNGAPTPGAIIVFHPADSSDSSTLRPSARVRDDGSFSLDTHPLGPGAPVGEYVIAIVWYGGPADSKTGDAPNKLPARYANPESSGLTATVEKGKQNLPLFELSP